MAGRDHADTRFIPYRGDDPLHLYAGNAEYGINALIDEGFYEGFATTHLHHAALPLTR